MSEIIGEIVAEKVKERDRKIREALKDTHLWMVDNLPQEMAARLLDFLGYELVVERPDIGKLGDDPSEVRIMERWYLQRNGQFITGYRDLYEKRQEYLRKNGEAP